MKFSPTEYSSLLPGPREHISPLPWSLDTPEMGEVEAPCSTLLLVPLVTSPFILPNCICSASICTTTAISKGFPRDKGFYFISTHSDLQNNVITLSHVCQEKTKLNSLNGIWRNTIFLPSGMVQPIGLYPAVPVLWCPPLWDVTQSRARGGHLLDLEENFSISITWKVI